MSDSIAGTGTSTQEETRETPAPRLKRLKINKFRYLRPTELVFDDEWNVLLGKNSTGKTTLLELIAATIRGDAGAFEGVDLDIEADLTLGPVHVKWTLKSAEASGLENVEENFPGAIVRSGQRRFHAEISGEGFQSFIVQGDERGPDGFSGRIMSSTGGIADIVLILMHGNIVGTFPDKYLPDAMRAASIAADVQRFDEVLTLFNRIGPTGDMVISWGPGIPPFERSLASDEVVDAFRDSLKNATDRISVDHDQLPFLNRFVELCGFSSASLHLELLRRNASRKNPHVSFGRPSFLFRRRNGEELREEHLSFGQKRLLSFLFYLTLSNPVIADELVDGLHFDWISACVEATRGRQKFFASQNPLLVDHMGFKNRAAVKSRFIRCSVDGDDMIWENFSDAEADDFFVAYRTGIQGVSEVLRQKGLW